VIDFHNCFFPHKNYFLIQLSIRHYHLLIHVTFIFSSKLYLHISDQETVLFSSPARLNKIATVSCNHLPLFDRSTRYFLDDHLPFVFELFLLLPTPISSRFVVRDVTVSVRFYLYTSKFGAGPVVVAGEWLYRRDPQVLAHGAARHRTLTTVGCRRRHRHRRRRHRRRHPAPSTWVHWFTLLPPSPIRRCSCAPTRRAVV